jgi:hypothetical protein
LLRLYVRLAASIQTYGEDRNQSKWIQGCKALSLRSSRHPKELGLPAESQRQIRTVEVSEGPRRIPLHTVVFGSIGFSLYVGLLALAINIAVAVVANASLMLGSYHAHVLRSFCRQPRIRS